MRRLFAMALVLALVALAAPNPAVAEVEKAVINILGGMQCSL